MFFLLPSFLGFVSSTISFLSSLSGSIFSLFYFFDVNEKQNKFLFVYGEFPSHDYFWRWGVLLEITVILISLFLLEQIHLFAVSFRIIRWCMWYKRFWNVDSLVLKMFCALNTKKLFSKKLIRTVTENIQIIEGFANPQETRKFCDLFCKERPTSLVKKYDSSFSSFFSFFNKVNYCNLDKHWQQALWLMEQVMSVSMKIIGVVCYRRLWIPAVMLFRYLKTNERITRNRWISRSRCWKRVLMGMLISSRMLIF